MSTPFDPEEPTRRPALEPTHVQRRRRPGALSELVRQVQERERERDPDEGYEVVAVPGWGDSALPRPTEDDTQELPPVRDENRPVPRGRAAARVSAHGRTTAFRRTALTVAAVAVALAGFGAALLLTWDRGATDAAEAPPPAASSAPSAPPAPPQGVDPDGAGTLREGDSGPQVSDLQERLLRIPDVYEKGEASGVYDATLTAAVARFQLWYGIRGDETGVYGNDTRTDLESRTAS
ncbi:peptidoglycan-binding protein [Streptomyces sp. Qhu-G9]|uniref:peptidoglycan-binding protein n=1 Tax=Streptomyces sp. Qhu-G9 TaxID=3452799 RepID=UPI0022AC6A06|nr:peptidoglycan-binding protein [Streptomyces aurantiacus]WAU83481.1 peptidoglycan-binding protein [Streptomyces aurantiacus]